MAVYVDQERNRFRRMIMCHMIADTAAELHEMAAAIGMKREWYQPLSFPHYDVCLQRRARAVQLGAIDVDRRTAWEIRKRIRAKLLAEPDFAATWRANPHPGTASPPPAAHR